MTDEQDHYLRQELYERVRTDPSIFEFLQRGSLDGIWYWDLENPDNEWMSPRFWETMGYDPAEREHLASEWQDLIDPDDLNTALENFTKHCEDPNHPYDQVVRYRHQDGSTVWVRCRGVAIRDESGKPVRMLGAHTDLTPQKQAEEALRKSEAQFRKLADLAPFAISILRGEEYLYVNSAWQELTEYTEEEAKALETHSVVHPDMREQVRQRGVKRTSGETPPARYEMKLITKGGEVRWCDFGATLIDYGDEPAILSVAADITEQKKADEEREQLIAELQKAIAEIKTLRGILPICSYCNKIRDDDGYWERVEVYIKKHTEADMSHGICPRCLEEHFPDISVESG